MGVLDAVLTDTGNQLGISNTSVGSVLSGLLSYISQEENGVTGFLDRFRRAGVGNLVSSWLSGDAKSVTPDTVESALGHQAIDRIGSKSGLSFSTAASAIALMLPRLVQRLAPGGAVPSRISAELMPYLTAPVAAVAAGARSAMSAAEAVTRPVRTDRRLLPLLALVAIIGLLALWLASRRSGNVVFNVEEQVRLASQRASAALTALRPGYSAQELTSAMNLSAINFATGSAQIPSDSIAFLNRAAAAIKSAPAGTVIEVGGHTDSTGDAGTNMQLSQQRADAVRAYLVQQGAAPGALSTRGYGDTRPVGPNDTDAGRFRNRRIEFTVR